MMMIVERKVSGENREIFDLDDFLSPPFRKYSGPAEDRWNPRFRDDVEGATGVPCVLFTP
jgi:hypothetical protein